MIRHIAVATGLLFLADAAAAQYAQQGTKLVGAGAVGLVHQARSVAISGDGNTVIVGAPGDSSNAGGAYVFTRTAGVWSPQGGKLLGTGAVGAAGQGMSVGISADGNTAIVGGPNDASSLGAAWVFIRSGGVWMQQGTKLVGTGATGGAQQGFSVAMSGDASTALVGGNNDHPAGAMWVFTRVAGMWLQQGNKLVGTGGSAASDQGQAVAISADGNTAVVGAPGDSSHAGASWVFSRSGGTWFQQSAKLVGTGAVGAAYQGGSVGISADGNTVIVGGGDDNSGVGAAWIYSRGAGNWLQQGGKLVAAGPVGSAGQGGSVAISGDGRTAVLGAPGDNSNLGDAWVFTRNGGGWSQEPSPLVAADGVGKPRLGDSAAASTDGSTVVLGGDFDNSAIGAAWVFSAETFTAWVPVASHNGGASNSQWRSDLGMLNAAGVTANVQLKFYGSGGVVSNTTYVPAHAQSILTDVVGQIGGVNSGAIEVLSDQPLKVTARSYNLVSSAASCYPNGTQGQDYPVLLPSNGLAAGQSAYLPGLTENTASYRCNIGVVNIGTGPASVLVELFDGAGNKFTDYIVTLTPGQWAQETQPFKNKVVPSQTAMDRGYAKITVQTGSGVFAFASVIDTKTNDPTTVCMQP